MPDRFSGHHIPGIFYAFPAECVIAIGQVGTAVLTLTAPGHGFSLIPHGAGQVWFAALLFLSGVLTLIGLIGYRRDWQAGIEQVGLWLGAAASACYALLILASGMQATFAGMVFASIAVASALRARAIRILQQNRLRELTVANQLREESARHARPDQ